MKKLILLASLLCINTVLFGQANKTQKLLAQSSVSNTTLNGITQDSAKSWVSRFRRLNVKKPLPTSVWFSKSMIQNMVLLLKSENMSGGKNIVPDGVRVYFASNSNNQSTVVLVSTYTYKDSLGITTHWDYFDHNTGANLFNANLTGPILGEVCNDNTCGGGATLYERCPCNDDFKCDRSVPHYITEEYAKQMVWNFGDDVVSTTAEWFDLALLDTFAKSTRLDGIRIYFAKHSVIDDLYPGKDAFVLVTTENKNNLHRDYFDCNDTQGYFSNLVKQAVMINAMKTNASKKIVVKIMGDDRGEQCQPSCQGVSL